MHYIGTGAREVLLDLNQVAFIPRGITTKDRHPSFGDVACIVVTPSPDILDEVWHGRDAQRPNLGSRTCVIRPLGADDQMRAGLMAARARNRAGDPASEEILLGMLRRTVQRRANRSVPVTSSSFALVAKVKELLSTASDLLSLGQIATAVGTSPAYLTDLFRRIEGVPVYRYQTRLRLARALARLPHAEDITQLALELGFSSHSHFSSAFRAAYGVTPSSYRRSAGSGIARPHRA
jgi:AraC-like DNA-binding protein